MKAKQKKIRVFDIFVEEESKFFDFMNKNLLLLRDYLLVMDGEITPKITEFLKENNLCYVLQSKCHLKMIDSSPKEIILEEKEENKTPNQEQKIEIIKEVIVEKQTPTHTKIINKPIRSGEIIESENDLVIFSRVNSGAKVICEANASIFGDIDGVVEVNGDFLILKSINKGYVIFNGEILEKNNFSGGYKKVLKSEDGYKIEDL